MTKLVFNLTYYVLIMHGMGGFQFTKILSKNKQIQCIYFVNTQTLVNESTDMKSQTGQSLKTFI